ncbi:hypothetical protein [Fictibacillus enclensis]|uniref:hypothetical protein n=1 Tax=Fictibacillus enclensis TaxID=1017270 RepID=UPI003336478F
MGNKRLIRIKRPEIKRWMNHYADLKDPNGNDVYSSGSRLKYLSVLKAYSIIRFTRWRFWTKIRRTPHKSKRTKIIIITLTIIPYYDKGF